MRIVEAHDTPSGDGYVARLHLEPVGPLGAVQEIPASMPVGCARCGGEASTTVRALGVGAGGGFLPKAKRRLALDVPYCESCRRVDAAEGRRASMLLLAVVVPLTGLAFWGLSATSSIWQIVFLAIAVLGLGAILAGVAILANPLRSGGAVRIVVPDSEGPFLLQFRTAETGRAFVAANGGVTPEEPTDDA